MTFEAKITNRTELTIYAEGYPLSPGESNTIPFISGKLSVVSKIGYVIIDEDPRISADCNSRLRVEKAAGHNHYNIVAK